MSAAAGAVVSRECQDYSSRQTMVPIVTAGGGGGGGSRDYNLNEWITFTLKESDLFSFFWPLCT